ncbi:MAG: dipicolinate synthase subunit A [Ruminococcus sp.]|nr:dipicolinate synthase subunit A [Ruminococcus sp.]
MDKILIAGGDERQLYCAEALSEKYEVYVSGHDNTSFPSPDGNADCLVLPVIPFDAEGNIYAPNSERLLIPEDIRSLLRSSAVVIAGRTDERTAHCFSGHPIADYLSREDFCIKNAFLTAEGAVELAISALPVSLNGLPVLIVGMGRIGCILAELMKAFGAQVTAAVHNPKGAAKAAVMGIASVDSADTGTDYGLVFNTVPEKIFGKQELEGFSRRTLFIDLASAPGGIDISAAEELGIKVIWARGLPAKCSPETAGRIIADAVEEILAERG